jgi:Methyltransferase domain
VSDGTRSIGELPCFTRRPWQMTYGERAALEGILGQLRPLLAIEIGRAEGGSLRRISAHAEHVISIDLLEPGDEAAGLGNVTVHVGDSHHQLRTVLEELAAAGRNVDFVLVDGDHSSEGARADILDLLGSSAITRTVILAHDSINEEVRDGLDAVPYGDFAKVNLVDLDFVPGYVCRDPDNYGQCWGGFALIVVDSSGTFGADRIRYPVPFPVPDVLWEWAEAFREWGRTPSLRAINAEVVQLHREVDRLRAELAGTAAVLDSVVRSISWRATRPLRAAVRPVRGALRRQKR